LLAARLQQLDELGNARRASSRSPLGRIDPTQIILAIEAGQPVKKPRGLGVGLESARDVGRQGLALRTLDREHDADFVADPQPRATPISRPQGQEIADARLRESAAHAAAVDRALNVVARPFAPQLGWIKRYRNVGAPFFDSADLCAEAALLNSLGRHVHPSWNAKHIARVRRAAQSTGSARRAGPLLGEPTVGVGGSTASHRKL